MPDLSKLAKAARIRGRVVFAALVDEHGVVQSLTLVSGHPLLFTAALDAAKDYRFKPATARGVPIESVQSLVLTFNQPEEEVRLHGPTRDARLPDLLRP